MPAPLPPLPSPGQPYRADRPDEPTTGEYFIAQVENVVRERERKGSPLSAMIVFATGAIGAVSVCFGAYFVVLSAAKAEAADQVKVVDQKASATQAQLDRYQSEANNRFERLEHQGNRNEAKLDTLLQALRVPNPAPAPKDAGSP
jgi:hypothetical protein